MSGSNKSGSSENKPPKEPSFSPSATFYGDTMQSQTYKDPKLGLVTKYLPSAGEKERQQYAEEGINRILPTLGATAPEMGQRFDQMRNDYEAQQTDRFSREWDKTMRNLREDTASRFGTLKATPYFDKMNSMFQDVYNPAILDIQRTGSIMRSDLDAQEQNRKLQELGAYSAVMGGDNQNLLQNLQVPLQSSQMMNQFNQNQYTQQLQAYQNQQAQRNAATNNFLGFLGRVM